MSWLHFTMERHYFQRMARYPIRTGLILTLILLLIHLLVIDDYGITWDFHHHFFAGLYHLGIPLKEALTKNIPFTIPDPRGTYDLPFGPLMLIAPTITYQIFHEFLGVMAFDNAYHLSIIVSGVAGVFVLYLFLLEAFGFITGLAGLAFLALLPRYFGDLHNNMKDVPQAAAFALAIYMFWRLAKYKRVKDLVFATLAFAIAFNTKVNTLLVPVIAGIWFFLTKIPSIKHQIPNKHQASSTKFQTFRTFGLRIWDLFRIWKLEIWYFAAAPFAAFLLWLPFWKHPLDRLVYMFRFFLDNTQNLEVLYFGTIYKSAINVPWHYALGYLGATTPLPTLVFFLIGLGIIVYSLFRHIRLKSNHELGIMKYEKNRTNQQSNELTKLLLLIWFFLPLTRYLNPKIGVIDGIRHFEEVVFPMAGIAAVGFSYAWVRLNHLLSKRNVKTVAVATINTFLLTLLLVSLTVPIIRYHPYQISYFNELVASNATRAFITGAGGIQGAWKNFDVEYWGTSQKAAVLWLNTNAPKDSYVHVLMAGDSAAKYLRPDLLARVNSKGFDEADYVVVLNRQSFFDRYWGITEYMPKHKIIYSVNTQGVPLTLIYDNKLGLVSPPAFPWWEKPKLPINVQIP